MARVFEQHTMSDSAELAWLPIWPRWAALVAGVISLLSVIPAFGLKDSLGNWPFAIPGYFAVFAIVLWRASRIAGLFSVTLAAVLVTFTIWITVAPPKGLSIEVTFFTELFRNPVGWLVMFALAAFYATVAYSIILNWRNRRMI
jgi:hypothetical protein